MATFLAAAATMVGITAVSAATAYGTQKIGEAIEGKPDAPAIAPLPEAPDRTKIAAQERQAQTRKRAAVSGRNKSTYTSSLGVADKSAVARKSLLGN